MKLTASYAEEMIAGKVNECQSIGQRVIRDLIYHGEFRAWRSGRWKGSEKTMTLKVYDDRFVLPDDYNVLLGVNIGRKNQTINSYWYEFDKFGPGTLEECTYLRDQVVELNDVTTPWPIAKGERLGVRSSRPESGDNFLLVQGNNLYDKEIYTQNLAAEDGEIVEDEVHGEKIRYKTGKIVVSETRFEHDGILLLLKEKPTNGTIYLYAISDNGQSRELGELRPEQMDSSLKCYRLPSNCCCQVVHALVKISEPKKITKDTDVLQIQNEEALILLVMSAYFEMHVFDPARSKYYFNQGIAALNGQYGQDKGGKIGRIRMSGVPGIDRSWNPPAGTDCFGGFYGR